MNSRGGSATALRRLMTEYKQLTSQGRCGEPSSRLYPNARPQLLTFSIQIPCPQAHRMACSRQVRVPPPKHTNWSSADFHHTSANRPHPEGPVSESDFFTWEALIVGPKDTPFEGGVFPAVLTFVRIPYVRCAKSIAHAWLHTNLPPTRTHPSNVMPPAANLADPSVYADGSLLTIHPGTLFNTDQPSDYPLSPFKMKFDPPLFHPNSKS